MNIVSYAWREGLLFLRFMDRIGNKCLLKRFKDSYSPGFFSSHYILLFGGTQPIISNWSGYVGLNFISIVTVCPV